MFSFNLFASIGTNRAGVVSVVIASSPVYAQAHTRAARTQDSTEKFVDPIILVHQALRIKHHAHTIASTALHVTMTLSPHSGSIREHRGLCFATLAGPEIDFQHSQSRGLSAVTHPFSPSNASARSPSNRRFLLLLRARLEIVKQRAQRQRKAGLTAFSADIWLNHSVQNHTLLQKSEVCKFGTPKYKDNTINCHFQRPAVWSNERKNP